MDLQDPNKKMSKSSESPQGTIGLFDDPATIERKIRRAVTDTDTGPDAVRYDPAAKPGVANLLAILAAIQGRRPEEVAGRLRPVRAAQGGSGRGGGGDRGAHPRRLSRLGGRSRGGGEGPRGGRGCMPTRWPRRRCAGPAIAIGLVAPT